MYGLGCSLGFRLLLCFVTGQHHIFIQAGCGLQIVLPLGDEPNKRAGKNPKRDSGVYPIEGKTVTSQTGEVGIVRRSPDMEALKEALQVWNMTQ